MAFVFSIKDSYRAAVEAVSGGKNTVLYDDKGNPSIMVVIPKFKLSDIDPTWPSDPHPAFIVNGVEKSEIFISKYQNIVVDGRAYSLPMQDPKVYVNFDQARSYCTAKGKGWHLMTNAEWAAIALWCWKNGFQPRGNNNYGSDHSAPHERGKETYFDSGAGKTGRVATGSGPASWYHDNTPFGIADLNGNVWEWVDGLKLHDGKIYVHGSGGVAMNNFETQNNSHDVTGWVDTGAYFDNTTAGDSTQSDHYVGGNPQLAGSITNIMYTPDPTTDAYYGYSSVTFENLTVKSGYTPPAMLKYLAIQPPGTGLGGDNLWVRNYGERLPIRGGFWGSGSFAGVFALDLLRARSFSGSYLGFRAAFIPV